MYKWGMLPHQIRTLNTQETVSQTCFVKKVFLKVSQNSQVNTCAEVSFLRLQTWGLRNVQKHFFLHSTSCFWYSKDSLVYRKNDSKNLKKQENKPEKKADSKNWKLGVRHDD